MWNCSFLSWVYLIRGNKFHGQENSWQLFLFIPLIIFLLCMQGYEGYSQRMKLKRRLSEILSFFLFLYIFLVPGSFNMFSLPCKRIYLKLKTKFNLYIFKLIVSSCGAILFIMNFIKIVTIVVIIVILNHYFYYPFLLIFCYHHFLILFSVINIKLRLLSNIISCNL